MLAKTIPLALSLQLATALGGVSALAAETAPAGCKADSASGLLWESKKDDKSLRHKEWRYRWPELGNRADTCGDLSPPCDTERYLSAINRLNNGPSQPPGLCGRQDWRLPSRIELESLLDRRQLKPAADPDRAPALEGDTYWSSTPYAKNEALAWAVDFDRGLVVPMEKVRHLRLVAVAGPAVPPTFCADASKNFQAEAEGNLAHAATRLVWQRCTVGQVWDGKGCGGSPLRLSWPEAQGTDGPWRLPTAAELSSLVATACADPAIAREFFPDTPSGRFWTATPAAAYPGFAWTVDFSDGSVGVDVKQFPNYVRRVRSLDASTP